MFSRFIIKKKWALYNPIVVLPVILQPSWTRTQNFISFGFFTVWRWFCDEPTVSLADWGLRAAAVYRHQGAVSHATRADTREVITERAEKCSLLFSCRWLKIFSLRFFTLLPFMYDLTFQPITVEPVCDLRPVRKACLRGLYKPLQVAQANTYTHQQNVLL